MLKYLKITPIIIIFILALQVFAHFNLRVSKRYEVDYESITTSNINEDEKISLLLKMKQREIEIQAQQRRNKIFMWIFSILLIINVVVIFFKKNKINANTSQF